MTVTIRPVEEPADRKAFVDLAYALNKDDPNWVPPLKTEVHGLIDPRTNPWFEHGDARFFIAEREGEPVGRISAQVDELVIRHMGPGIGQWGMFEAADGDVARDLIHRAEAWLRGRDMTRSMGPFSLSIWDEPGLLIKGRRASTRADVYKLNDDDIWGSILLARTDFLTRYKDTAVVGIETLPDGPGRDRLVQTAAFMDFMKAEMALMRAHWNERREALCAAYVERHRSAPPR